MEQMPEQGKPPVSSKRYSHGAILLHWLIAAAFAFQIGLGWRMDAPRGPSTFAVYQLHKSVGITILLLTLIRIAWRLARPAPAFPSTMSGLERRLATAVHAGFYIVLLALPLTGWMLVSSSSTAIPTYLYGVLSWPHMPGVESLAPSAKAGVNAVSAFGHHALVIIAYVLLFLHVAGALKHQFYERGDDLGRMLPLEPRRLGFAAVAAIATFGLLVAIGNLVALRPIALAPSPAPRVTPSPEMTQAAVAPPPAPRSTPIVTTTPRPEETPVAVMPSEWAVRPAASSLGFQAAWSQAPVDGRFGKWTAAIVFDPDALDASSVKVSIDMASATTNDASTQAALPGADWFSVATHPIATFSATRFRHLSGNRYQALGTLSLRGVSRSLTLPFTLTITGDVATMTGSATIDRTAFGVGQGEWAGTTDLPAGVSINVAIKADRKPPKQR